jgi:Putative metallopeptidase
MRSARKVSLSSLVVVAGLAGANAALAQSPPPPVALGDNDSIYIDPGTFTLTPGKPKSDISPLIQSLGARELGAGAIVFRSGHNLYIVDAPLPAGTSNGQNVYITAQQAWPDRIHIEYVEPKSDQFKPTYELLKQVRGLETMQQILAPLILPEDLTIRAKECGMVNAWYIREDGKPTVTICYDYLDNILQSLPKDKTRAGITRTDAAAGQFFWLVTHETGHAVFDIFGIPVFGHEEDAADNFAAYIMLQFGKERARRLIGGAAWAYHEYISDYRANRDVQFKLAGFASNHGQPEQRFYNLMCMAYGADPATFGDLVQEGWLPPSRSPSCHEEYQKLSYAFRKLIGPHIDLAMAQKVLDTNWLPASTTSALPPPPNTPPPASPAAASSTSSLPAAASTTPPSPNK